MNNSESQEHDCRNADAVDSNRITVTRIPFRGFVKFSACLGMSIGIVLGLAASVFSLTGELDFKLNDRLGGFEAEGIEAGLLFLLSAPLYFFAVTTLLSIPAYFPFSLLIRTSGGISVRIEPVASAKPDAINT